MAIGWDDAVGRIGETRGSRIAIISNDRHMPSSTGRSVALGVPLYSDCEKSCVYAVSIACVR